MRATALQPIRRTSRWLAHWYFYCSMTKWHWGYRAVFEVWFDQVSESSDPHGEQNPSGNTAGCQLVRWSLALQRNVKPGWPSQSIYTSGQCSRVTHSDYRTGPIQWSNAASAVLGLPQKACPKRVFVFKVHFLFIKCPCSRERLFPLHFHVFFSQFHCETSKHLKT